MDQKKFSYYIGATRSQISMAEIGKRELSGKPFMELLDLFQSARKSNKARNSALRGFSKEQEQKRTYFIEQQLLQHQDLLEMTIANLTKMKRNYRLSLNALTALPTLKKPLNAFVYNCMEMKHKKMYAKNDLVAQLKLELKIKALQAEIRFLESQG